MKSFFTTIIFVFAIFISQAQTWNTISTGFSEADFDCLQAVNGSVCYAAGYDGIASNTLIIKTTDGGDNWTDITPESVEGYVNSIAFSDENNGFFTLSTGKIFKTIDGGENWQQTQTDEDGNIFVVKYAENNTFYTLNGSGKIYKTSDMGSSWSVAYNYGSNVFLNVILSYGQAMDFSSENFAIFSYGSEPGELYVYDGYELYSTYSAENDNPFETVCAINDDLFYASSGARFVRISNPGSDYQITNNLTNALYINSLDFYDAEHGFGSTSTGKIYRLSSLGSSYFTEYEDASPTCISIGDNYTVFACGHDGLMLKRDGAITDISEQNNNNFDIKVFPNPSNDNVNIHFEKTMNAKIEIFDLTGKIIYNQVINSDKFNYKFNNSGIYFVKINSEFETFCEKVIIY